MELNKDLKYIYDLISDKYEYNIDGVIVFFQERETYKQLFAVNNTPDLTKEDVINLLDSQIDKSIKALNDTPPNFTSDRSVIQNRIDFFKTLRNKILTEERKRKVDELLK
jgi:hypothetical protein